MGRLQLDDLTTTAKDVGYASVGLGLLAFQRLQVRRHELTKALHEHSGGVNALVSDRVKMVEERLTAAIDATRH